MANNYLQFSESLDALVPDEVAWLEQLETIHVYGNQEYRDGDVVNLSEVIGMADRHPRGNSGRRLPRMVSSRSKN